jgi:ABC-2 type transport system ATP-binding protein
VNVDMRDTHRSFGKNRAVAAVPGAVAAAVERVDLGPKARAKLRTLSGGMLRRVGIAQAIVNNPDLLLLDEPTAGLDPEQWVQFRTLLRSLGGTSTVVVSTHLVEDIGAACSEVALMSAGKIVFRGTPDELTARGVGYGVGDAPLERGYSAVRTPSSPVTSWSSRRCCSSGCTCWCSSSTAPEDCKWPG